MSGVIGDIASVLTAFMVFYLVIQNFFLEKEVAKLKAVLLGEEPIEIFKDKTDDEIPPPDDAPPPDDPEPSPPKPTASKKEDICRYVPPPEPPPPMPSAPEPIAPMVSHSAAPPMPSPAKRPLVDVKSKVVEAFETITRSCKSEVSEDPSQPTVVVEKRWKIDGFVADNGMDQQLMDKEMEIFQKRFKNDMQGVGVIDGD